LPEDQIKAMQRKLANTERPFLRSFVIAQEKKATFNNQINNITKANDNINVDTQKDFTKETSSNSKVLKTDLSAIPNAEIVLLHPLVNSYIQKNSSSIPSLIQRLASDTKVHFGHKEHNLVGPIVGQFLHMLVKLRQPKTVLEIGTFTGFKSRTCSKKMHRNDWN
jgi:hypothetical protein